MLEQNKPLSSMKFLGKVILTVTAALICHACIFASHAHADTCPSGGEHDYVATIIQYSTEDTPGLRAVRCVKCGYETTQVIPATGHVWGEWVVEVAPSCSSEGLRTRACLKNPNNPHPQYEIIPMLSANGAHDYQLVREVSPTCTEPGVSSYACSICGAARDETQEAIGHAWGEWIIDTPPTEGREGKQTRICQNNSQHVETASIPALIKEKEVEVRQSPEPTAPPEPITAEEPPEDTFWTFKPNAVDAVSFSLSGIALVVFFIIALPGIVKLIWVRKKRKEAYERALATIMQESEK